MSEDSISISMPLDDDGFLRRECPACERDFKWRPTPHGEDAEAAPDPGYGCPYCSERAPSDHWWTRAQLAYAKRRAASDIVGPALEKLERRGDPDALISFEVTVDPPRSPDPLQEPNDMRRVEFECHPREPVKVRDDWTGPVHCLICGTASDTAAC